MFYYQLWDILKAKGMTQKELAKKAFLSEAVVSKMRCGGNVQLSVLEKICDALECDIGDIATVIPPRINYTLYISDEVKNTLSDALGRYMANHSLCIRDIAEKVNVSINTIKAILNRITVSKETYLQLLMLGEDFTALFDVNQFISKQEFQKRIYCAGEKKNTKKCLAFRRVFDDETCVFSPKCELGFCQMLDAENRVYTECECPRPINVVIYETMRKGVDSYENKCL